LFILYQQIIDLLYFKDIFVDHKFTASIDDINACPFYRKSCIFKLAKEILLLMPCHVVPFLTFKVHFHLKNEECFSF